jgi:hypothetical protein
MNEAGYIDAIRKRLPPEIYSWKIHDRFTAGVPDLYLAAASGKSLWIEFKYQVTTPIHKVTPRLSKAQTHWLQRHHDSGHQVMVIVGSPAGATIFTAENNWGRFITTPTKLSYDEVVQTILEIL